MSNPVKIWRNQGKIRDLLGLTGEIVTWTFVRLPPSGFSSIAPYPVALVSLTNGKRITVQLVDWLEDDVKKGRKVEMVIRRVREATTDGVIPYGIKARPRHQEN